MLREFSAGGIVYFRCCPPKGNNKGIIPWEGRHPAACCGGLHKKEGDNFLWLIRRPKGGKVIAVIWAGVFPRAGLTKAKL